MAKMKDADLRDLVAKRRDASFKHVTGALARDRREALMFYRGDNDACYGDSGDGLSTVVSRDTMEAIESLMPPLMKPFVSGDETVRFEPTGPEDEEGAKQATEYINYLFSNHNDAFRVVYDSLKDGMLYRYGCAKVVMEEAAETEFETFRDLTDIERMALEAMVEEEDDVTADGEVEQNPDGTFNLTVQRTIKRKLFKVIVIPPDRFLYEPRIASLEEGTFFAHHDEQTVGDLIAMGLPKDKCEGLQAGSPISADEDVRFDYEADGQGLDSKDPARRVWVDECYIRCDYEGDGILRWRRVIVAGNSNTLLLDEEADDHPFAGWTPIPEPHKLIGQSVADLTRDIQKQKTAVQREAFNALYLANRPQREVLEGQVNIDDLLSPTVGGVVRVKSQGAINPIPSGGEGVMRQSAEIIEYLDTVRESRTGVTRYNQGMDANSLNKTATGVSIITNAAQQRQELIARQYAESFLKPVFRKMLKLTVRYEDKAQVIRLRGVWVEMDPREWKTGYDMSIAVGLGTGNKDQQMAHLTNLMAVQQQIAQGQGGLEGPIVTWSNVYEAAKQIPESMGLKGVEKFFTDPEKQQEGTQTPAEDPSAAAMAQQQAEAQRHAAELQAKHDADIEKATIDADAKVRVASIGAVKELVMAGLTIPEAEAVVQSAPDVFAGPNAGGEGEDMAQMQPEPVMGEEMPVPDIDPALLDELLAKQPPQDGLPPEGLV